MRYSGLNTNKERRLFWESLVDEKGEELLQKALASIDTASAKVLIWHYKYGYCLNEITGLLQRSISTVRNYHNRGIFELQQYFQEVLE